MMTDELIKSEMVAEKFIEDIKVAKSHLTQGERDKCLAILEELECAMEVTLAVGELCDIENDAVELH